MVAVAALAAGVASSQASDGSPRRDRDCSDFSTQREAQNYFESLGPGDPDQLDGDGDGRACEDLPCPCSSGGGSPGGGGGQGGLGHRRHARVSDIADGDTIEVRVRRRTEDVRLIGIDTPEIYFGAECGGAQASASIRRILHAGDRVRLIRDRSQDNRDHYGRLLRYVEHSGRDVGRRQIRKGWAKVYVFETPFDRVGGYRHAENAAHRSDRGAWRLCGGDFHDPL
jgi:endonuclease YncB( thermonuclease family)